MFQLSPRLPLGEGGGKKGGGVHSPHFQSQGLCQNLKIILLKSENTVILNLNRHQEIQNRPIRIQNTDPYKCRGRSLLSNKMQVR